MIITDITTAVHLEFAFDRYLLLAMFCARIILWVFVCHRCRCCCCSCCCCQLPFISEWEWGEGTTERDKYFGIYFHGIKSLCALLLYECVCVCEKEKYWNWMKWENVSTWHALKYYRHPHTRNKMITMWGETECKALSSLYIQFIPLAPSSSSSSPSLVLLARGWRGRKPKR